MLIALSLYFKKSADTNPCTSFIFIYPPGEVIIMKLERIQFLDS